MRGRSQLSIVLIAIAVAIVASACGQSAAPAPPAPAAQTPPAAKPATAPATAPGSTPAAAPAKPPVAPGATPGTTPAAAAAATPGKPAPASAPPAGTPPAAAGVAPGKPAAPAASAPAATPQDTYTYRADGRRDPFLSLVGGGTEGKTVARKGGEGPATMTVGEISVRGIMQSRGSLVAMISGPDNKTYIVHQGDKFLDGTIKTVTPQGLIVVQEVNDPLSLIKQREVRKLLRSLEDAKE